MTRRNGDGTAVGVDDTRLQQIDRVGRIRDLNDRARAALAFRSVLVTVGVRSLHEEATSTALAKVRSFDAFTADNDPYGEHDLGSFKLGGERLFWKIDYYDRTLSAGSPDPADPSVTARVLTIMLASEY
jgi:hypothetical protein